MTRLAMRWRKLGHCVLPRPFPGWMHSHAAVPFAEVLDARHIRVWFSGRDIAGRSHTGWALIDLKMPNQAMEIVAEPILAPGNLGCFDDSGAMLSWIAGRGDERHLYYVGWNLGVTVPFRNSIGLAISHAGSSFKRFAQGPILDRSAAEPHFVASCCVLPGEDYWRMWYLACEGWDLVDDKPRHRYLIRYAESADGIVWNRTGHVAIGFGGEEEYAISRPSVIKDGELWKMWYSYRGQTYRIGYAESANGRDWQRLDHLAGIGPGPQAWDDTMIEYPHVFDVDGERYMLYNGNGYGCTGFGLAILEHE